MRGLSSGEWLATALLASFVLAQVPTIARAEDTERSVSAVRIRTQSFTGGPLHVMRHGAGFSLVGGLVATSLTLVDALSDISVEDQSGNLHTAKIVATDPTNSVAILSVETAEAEPEAPNPSMGGTAGVGAIAAICASGDHAVEGRFLSTDPDRGLIFTSLEIPWDCIGAPVVDTDGQIVGLIAAGVLPEEGGTRHSALVASASSISSAIRSAEHPEIVKPRAVLGVAYSHTESGGSIITALAPDSPAAAAGLAVGDIVLKIDELEISASDDLVTYVQRAGPGARVVMLIQRNGQLIFMPVTLGEIAAEVPISSMLHLQPYWFPQYGLAVREVVDSNSVPSLAIVALVSGGKAEKAGLVVNTTYIRAVGLTPASSVSHFIQGMEWAMARNLRYVPLRVEGETMDYLSLDLRTND